MNFLRPVCAKSDRRPYLLGVIVLAYLASVAGAEKLYMASDGSHTWNGDPCDASMAYVCNVTSPCKPSSYIFTSNSDQCEIYFVSSSYSTAVNWSIYGSGNVTIWLGEALPDFELVIESTAPNPLVVDVWNPNSIPGLKANITTGSLSISSTVASITVSNVRLDTTDSTALHLSSGPTASTSLIDCELVTTSTTTSPLQLNASTVLLQRTLIKSPGIVAIGPASTQYSSVSFVDSTFLAPRGILSADSVAALTMQGVTYDALGLATVNAIISAPRLTPLSISSSTFTGSPTLRPSLATILGTLKITDSTITGISIATGLGLFDSKNTTFFDVEMSVAHSATWKDVTISQRTSDAKVALAAGGSMSNVVFNNPSGFSRARFEVSNRSGVNVTTGALASLTISDLFVDSTTEFRVENLIITNSIVGASPASSLLKSITSDTIWNFHSIRIENVNIYLEQLGAFIYTATNATSGITSENSIVQPKPLSVTIAWPSPTPPVHLLAYPIVEIQAQTVQEAVQTYQAHPGSPYNFGASFLTPPLLSFQSFGSTPSACSNPPPGFMCAPDGTLYAAGSIFEPSITIPANSGTVNVYGNVTVNTTITFIGTGSNLNVSGCVVAPDGVVVEIQKGKPLPSQPVVLVTQSSACPSSISSSIHLKNPNQQGCEKTTAKQDPNAPKNQLVVLFNIDKSGCNTKWIILGSTLGGVLLILLVLALVFSFNKSARNCIRPYSNRNHDKRPGTM